MCVFFFKQKTADELLRGLVGSEMCIRDSQEGGAMRFVGRGEDAPDITCTILRVDEPMLLEHTHVDPASRLRWELEPVSYTHLTLPTIYSV